MFNFLKSQNFWWWGLITIGLILPAFSLLLSGNGLLIFQRRPAVVQSLVEGKLLLSAMILAGFTALFAIVAVIMWMKTCHNEHQLLKDNKKLYKYLKSSDLQIRELREVDSALLQIATGNYGVCQDCDEPIEHQRLEAYPTAKRCHRCQVIYEQTHVQEGHPTL